MVRRERVPLLQSQCSHFFRASFVSVNLRMCQLAQFPFAGKFSEYKAMTRKGFEEKPDA